MSCRLRDKVKIISTFHLTYLDIIIIFLTLRIYLNKRVGSKIFWKTTGTYLLVTSCRLLDVKVTVYRHRKNGKRGNNTVLININWYLQPTRLRRGRLIFLYFIYIHTHTYFFSFFCIYKKNIFHITILASLVLVILLLFEDWKKISWRREDVTYNFQYFLFFIKSNLWFIYGIKKKKCFSTFMPCTHDAITHTIIMLSDLSELQLDRN